MGKSIVVHSLPDRKIDFRIWVDKIRSPKKFHKEQAIKSIYIRKSAKNIKNWNNIQSNSRNQYQKKIKLMEEIRLRKVEDKTVGFVYAPRYACSTIAGSK
jgi:AAA15 family ATPase/GTPase